MRAHAQEWEGVPAQWWYGGGTDITPSYVHDDDMHHFHGTYKDVCDRHDPEYYQRFRQWCGAACRRTPPSALAPSLCISAGLRLSGSCISSFLWQDGCACNTVRTRRHIAGGPAAQGGRLLRHHAPRRAPRPRRHFLRRPERQGARRAHGLCRRLRRGRCALVPAARGAPQGHALHGGAEGVAAAAPRTVRGAAPSPAALLTLRPSLDVPFRAREPARTGVAGA